MLLALFHKIFSRIYPVVVSVTSLKEKDKKRLFELMGIYYADMDYSKFERDLEDKSKVILLKESATRRIIGFSTVKIFPLVLSDGEKAQGAFSGDTIIEREFWGGTALQLAFFRVLYGHKIANLVRNSTGF